MLFGFMLRSFGVNALGGLRTPSSKMPGGIPAADSHGKGQRPANVGSIARKNKQERRRCGNVIPPRRQRGSSSKLLKFPSLQGARRHPHS